MTRLFKTARSFLTLALLTGCITLSLAEERAPQTNRKPVESTRVQFKAFDGSDQLYYEYEPKKLDPARPTLLILALHGHGSDGSQPFNGVYAEFNATLDLAAENNAIVVAPDYRARTSWMGPAAEKDVLQILEEQKAKRKINAVMIMGGSMGASSALTFAALHPDLVDGVVAMNPTANHLEYENFQDAICESYGGAKRDIPMEYKNRSAEYFPERFVSIPTAITLGSLDKIVPPDSARRLAAIIEKLGGQVLCIERDDLGHTTPYEESRRALLFVLTAMSQTNE